MLVYLPIMEGNIYINGQIGTYENVRGVELKDVINQVQGQPFATSFNVYINSEGGVVDVGFDIYNYLRSLNVPITTIGVGLVASIATVIFMAGDTRKFRKGTEFMIHLPSGMVAGTSQDIEAYNEMLKKLEKQMVDFYKKATNLTEEAIYPLLKNESWLTADDAFNMNFITEMEVEFAMVAKAFINTNLNKSMTQEDKSWIESQFEKFTGLFGKKVVALVLQDANGAEINFPDLEDGATPKVGDMATVDGQPAEGEYIMPSLGGVTVIFVGGSVAEIREAEGDGNEEMEALKAENEALKQQLADAVAKETASVEKLQTIETEFTNFKKEITGKFEFDKKKEEKGEEVSPVKARLEKIKNKK